MRKTIIKLSLAVTLWGPHGVAMEGEQVQILRAQNLSLREHFGDIELRAGLALSLAEYQNGHLQRVLARVAQEQAAENQLLDDVLHQAIPHPAIPIAAVGMVPNPLSAYQEQLRGPWQEGKIGPKAWAALGGSNISLAAALLRSIQGYAGQNVEIFYLGDNNFKFMVDGKKQHIPYKY